MIGRNSFEKWNFTALQEINPEIVAWLYCPDTVINYPVTQGEDNEYYLTHLVDGTSNSNGCLFIDCRNSGDFSDGNTVIYGHHMASGRMFASLVRYVVHGRLVELDEASE